MLDWSPTKTKNYSNCNITSGIEEKHNTQNTLSHGRPDNFVVLSMKYNFFPFAANDNCNGLVMELGHLIMALLNV